MKRIREKLEEIQYIVEIPYMDNAMGRLMNVDILVKEALALIDEMEKEETHDWYCGCGHWNGPNLAICAMCGRTPNESYPS